MIGHGQVDTMSRPGQNRSNFLVGISEKNWCLSDSVFYSELIGNILTPVDGQKRHQKWIQKIYECYFDVCKGSKKPSKVDLKKWCMLF